MHFLPRQLLERRKISLTRIKVTVSIDLSYMKLENKIHLNNLNLDLIYGLQIYLFREKYND